MTVQTVAIAPKVEKTPVVRRPITGDELYRMTGIGPSELVRVDVAYMSHERFQQVQSHSYLDVAPELIVEVMSSDDTWTQIQEKLAEYFAIDVKVIWVVDPKLKQIHSYRALDDVQIYRFDDELTCEEILPDFVLPLREIFDDV